MSLNYIKHDYLFSTKDKNLFIHNNDHNYDNETKMLMHPKKIWSQEFKTWNCSWTLGLHNNAKTAELIANQSLFPKQRIIAEHSEIYREHYRIVPKSMQKLQDSPQAAGNYRTAQKTCRRWQGLNYKCIILKKNLENNRKWQGFFSKATENYRTTQKTQRILTSILFTKLICFNDK